MHKCTPVCMHVCKHIHVPTHELTREASLLIKCFPCYLLILKNFPKAWHFLLLLAFVYGFGFCRGLCLALKPQALPCPPPPNPALPFYSCCMKVRDWQWVMLTETWSVSVNLKLVEFYSLLIQCSFFFLQILQKILICSFSIRPPKA